MQFTKPSFLETKIEDKFFVLKSKNDKDKNKFLKKILTDNEIKQIKKNQKIYYKIAGKLNFLVNFFQFINNF